MEHGEPKSGGQDGSFPAKRLDELSSEVSLNRTRIYPNGIHLSIRKKYSLDTVQHNNEEDDPLPVLQTGEIEQDCVLKCLFYLKLIHCDELSS